MEIPQGEQARHVSFDSPMRSFATSPAETPTKHQRTPNTTTQNLQQNKQAMAEPSRSNLPTLNVITNFSRHMQTSMHKPGLSIQERRSKREPSPARMNPLSALSPSDRTLVIGISPETSSIHDIHHDDQRSAAPEIVITHAKMPTNTLWKQKNWRPRSSMYSQMTRLSRALSVSQIPPVPPLPTQDQYPIKARPMSAVSWHTDFSEDDEKDVVHRSLSGEKRLSNLRGLNRHASHRRSEGWWNTMLSPIFGRSNTLSRKAGHALSAEEPKTPWTRQFLQRELTLDKGQAKPSNNTWEGLNQADVQRQTLAFFSQSPLETKKPMSSVHENPVTPEIIQEGGFGLASEYYEASWHDAYSPTQFFKCQGHDCGQKVAYRHGKTIGGPDNVTVLPGLTATNLASIQQNFDNNSASLEQPTITARDITLQNRPATPIHVRNDSNETIIENAPDARSQFMEARSILSSTASSPRQEIQKTKDSRDRAVTKAVADPVNTNTRLFSDNKIMNSLPSGKDSRYGRHTPESMSVRSRQILSNSPLKAPLSQKQATPARVVVNPPLEDPFHDIYQCDSPETFTHELQKEISQQRAVPYISARAITSPNIDANKDLAAQHDVLNIDAPRKAPSPPRIGSPQDTLYTQGSELKSALGISVLESTGIKKDQNQLESKRHYLSEKENASTRGDNQFKRSDPDLALSTTKPEDSSETLKNKKNKNKTRGFLVCCLADRNKDNENRAKKKWYFLIGGSLLALIILIVVLILMFTLHRSDAPVQTTWLNITGFPPIPTGIATIAQPDAAIEESQCVAPNTLWSCALPKEQQASIAPNLPDQPNFRLEIRFQNGSSTLNSNTSLASRSLSNAARASAHIRNQILQARDSFTTSLFTPSPAPPSQEDQIFLGNTTDNNTLPFQGEATPFFISFLPTATSGSTQALSVRDSADPFPNVTAAIPPPSINPDGTAASANLLPFPSAQPLMLYNRGRNDEHYGFYTYFDRSIFMKSTDLLNSTGPDIPDNSNGGALASAADVRCTWAQTRFLVQIWTNAGNALQLLSANNTSMENSTSSATDFNQPGSFPYPVSITLDRHGGNQQQKMVYCYGMDETEHIISSEKQVHLENRAFGGLGLINPGGRLFGAPVNTSIADGGPGGIDGGFGGCRCQWRNWIET